MANHKVKAQRNNIKLVFHVNEELDTHIRERTIAGGQFENNRSAYLRHLVRKDMGETQPEEPKQ